jgi:hypothetical protein
MNVFRNLLVGLAFSLALSAPPGDAATWNSDKGIKVIGTAEIQIAGKENKEKAGKGDKGGAEKSGDKGKPDEGNKGKNDESGKGKAGKNGDSDQKTSDKNGDKGKASKKNGKPEIESDEIDKARRYLGDNPDAFGSNKPKSLPPGIAKNLERGKPLPPGVAKTRLPDGFASQLPNYEGHDWSMVGQDLVLMDQETNLVVDVVRNMLQ